VVGWYGWSDPYAWGALRSLREIIPRGIMERDEEKFWHWVRKGRKPWGRKIRIAPISKKRRAKRRAEERVYGPYHRWVNDKPCLLRGHPEHICMGAVKGHHIHRVGNGGEDAANEVPLCQMAHTLSMLSVHVLRESRFDQQWGTNVRRTAVQLYDEYLAEAA